MGEDIVRVVNELEVLAEFEEGYTGPISVGANRALYRN